MKILITGICGFGGSTRACALLKSVENLQVTGVDKFIHPGSELNVSARSYASSTRTNKFSWQ